MEAAIGLRTGEGASADGEPPKPGGQEQSHADQPGEDRSRQTDLRDTIIIRTPIPSDREPARTLCKAMHARTVFADIPFSDTKFDRGADLVLARPRHTVGLVAELNDRLVGAAWASAGEYFIGERAVLTTVHFIGVDVEFCGRLLSAKVFLRLIAGLRKWSQSRGAKHLLIHVTTGGDLVATDRLLRASGMSCIGGGYVGA